MLHKCTELDLNFLKKFKIQARKRGNQGNKAKNYYKDVICAFDIETTRIKEIEQAVMYIWQFQIDTETFIGRTWEEFLTFIAKLDSVCKDKEYFVVFVHNLSYEFQFLKGILDFQTDDVFAIDARKILKAVYSHIEFRCSYLHSNMGLAEYVKKMGAEHKKLSGAEFDYSKTRWPWTELTEREMEYCANDVIGLVEAIKIDMNHEKDNLYTFTLTSTGLVRRDAKKAMRQVSHYFVRRQVPSFKVYTLCREAFRGGNTHANRYYSGFTLHNVQSADRSSSYPEVICNGLFPIDEFYEAGDITMQQLCDVITRRRKAVLMRISFTNIRLQDDGWGCPYLAKDKCFRIFDGVFDNGRVLSASYLETTITDIDLRIILDEYTFDDAKPYDVCFARYGPLPQALKDCIIKYYRAKTELKNVAGEELYYMKSKNKLNSIYGMMAQDPVKQSYIYKDGDYILDEQPPELLLEKSNKKAFLCYQWGVWTTALARAELEEGIKLAGDGFVYADTDSVKYKGEIDWNEYNKKKIAQSTKSGAFATDPKGITHHMGVFEYEGNYAEFATLGAKKYCFKHDLNSPLEVTIAGVDKKKGGPELERAGGIEAFKEGFIFSDAGGTEAVYNDHPDITSYNIDGHTIAITSNVVIRESTYTLGITYEYQRLLERSHEFIDFKNERYYNYQYKPKS